VDVERAQRVGLDDFGAVDLGQAGHLEHGASFDVSEFVSG
jgi:hypothetical protein